MTTYLLNVPAREMEIMELKLDLTSEPVWAKLVGASGGL